jgi:radical SAM/Cys-rich protein
MTRTISVPLTVDGDHMPTNDFDRAALTATGRDLTGLSLDTVQVNIGLRCNLACHHCHVRSSPTRTEQMDWPTMLLVLDAARQANAKTLDITGGAPELHPNFRRFVQTGVAMGLHVMVRTNLTIMLQPDYAGLPHFFAEQGVHLIASLPCYLEVNVDKQRGEHVYHDSIEVIQRLNHLGYGRDPRLMLDLVYNPGGPSLPPAQKPLEEAYRLELFNRFGIRFNRLYTITNVPIGRFQHDLERDGQAGAYARTLRDAFNGETLGELMCRHQLHVGWDGTMYDCDFNYALGLPVNETRRHIRDFDPAGHLRRRIATGTHCFACTAGCGSSCKGSLV